MVDLGQKETNLCYKNAGKRHTFSLGLWPITRGKSTLKDHAPALNIANPGLYDVKDEAGLFPEVNTFSSQFLEPMTSMTWNKGKRCDITGQPRMLTEAVSETLSGPQLSYYIPLSWAPAPQPQLNKQGHEKAQHGAPWGGHHHTRRSATDEATKSSGETAGWTRLPGQVPAPNASSQPHPEST